MSTTLSAPSNECWRCMSCLSRQQDKGLGHARMSWLNPYEPGGGLPDAPSYDMMLTLDAVHDMARPDKILPLVRKVVT